MLHFYTASSRRTAAAKMCSSMSPRLNDRTPDIGTLGEGQAIAVDAVEGQRGPEPTPCKGALGLG